MKQVGEPEKSKMTIMKYHHGRECHVSDRNAWLLEKEME